MKRKRYETICGIISFMGFMFVLGTVGGMEHETITLGQGMLQSIIGIAVFAGAEYIGGLWDDKEKGSKTTIARGYKQSQR